MSKTKLSLKLSGQSNLAAVYVSIDGWMVGFHQGQAELIIEPGHHTMSYEIVGEPGGSVKISLAVGGEPLFSKSPKIPAGEHAFADFHDFSI